MAAEKEYRSILDAIQSREECDWLKATIVVVIREVMEEKLPRHLGERSMDWGLT